MLSGPAGFRWTVIILTCQHKDSVYAFQKELDLRQTRGSVGPGTLLLTASDPEERLGSGGATLNALLVAAEHLSARAGHTVVTADVLEHSHILVLHTGRDYPWGGCSRAFSWLAEEAASPRLTAPVCCVDQLLDRLDTQICPGSPPGVWVCSTDMLLSLPLDYAPSWEGFSGVRVLALPGDPSFAAHHGVYLADQQGTVKDIIYRGSSEEIQRASLPDGNVPMVSGVVFFSSSVSERLLQTHVTPPLDGCTYLGLDSGAPPLQVVAAVTMTTATNGDRFHQYYMLCVSRPEDLWAPGKPHPLLEARLFPALQARGGAVGLDQGGVAWLLGGAGSLERWRGAWRLSLRELLSLTDQEAELRWREELLFLVGRRRVIDTLTSQSDDCLLPCFRAAVLGSQQGELLKTLDSKAGAEACLGVAARALACVADVLVCMAGEGRGGLRSGPAANQAWSPALSLLEEGQVQEGVASLARERELWLHRPDLLVRAARHYEGAGQVLLRRALMSSHWSVSTGPAPVPPLDRWQEVDCPARLDLAGGWSDTPPIAFEHGGSVTNMAVRVDGQRPIGARARRIREPLLLLVSHAGGRDSEVATETVCESLEDLKDHCQPHAPGALLKAVCVCSGLVSLSSQQPLGQQLMERWGGGVELHSWSLLPHGSGLGTSSILAGALLAAVYLITGRSYSPEGLVHAVLHLEQLLTTGGGWQDQVGGLVGGVKVGRSRAALPLRVEVERLTPSQHFLEEVQRHLLLVYTGKTRLARNLLQDVVRSWYARLPSIVQNAHDLVANSEACVRAFTEGSLQGLGACLRRARQQKRQMVPGCEPSSVRLLMEALEPLALGHSLAGAGGGGFLYLLTREPLQRLAVLELLQRTPGLGDFSVHSVELDPEGLSVLLPLSACCKFTLVYQ
uniref:L-fucose kinase n=1 Tax=Gadus morhua TaxID=8049 RepID=A0A8C5CDC6_GADMO